MKKEKKQFSWRKLFNDIHLWLGIGGGLILFLVCLSGTIYTFRSEIEELLEPSKYEVAVPEGVNRLSAEEIIEKAKHDIGGVVYSVEIPHEKSRPYQLYIKISPEERRGINYLINPYTGEVKGSAEGPASDFFMSMFRLHRWLLLDQDIGRPVVGTATIIFSLLILSGLVLWWPKKIKSWKQGFKVKTGGNWKRVNHDLHNTLGFYTFPLLLVMCLTGLCWSFEWYRDGLSTVLDAKVFGGRGEKPLASGPKEESAGLIRPLHTGEIFGTFSKILYFISCIIATSLPVTSTIIWISKLRKKSKKKGKRTSGRETAMAGSNV